MHKKKLIIVIVVVVVTALFLTHMPKPIKSTMTVSTGSGETAVLDIDVLYYPNLVLPSYVKGTLLVDGIEYTDQYTMFQKFQGVSDNRLFPADWWKAKGSVPCNTTFIRSDCTDIISATLNHINVWDIAFHEGISKIHYMYMDERNQIGTSIAGISFWGPAQNAQEAADVAAFFGYQTP